MTPDQIPDVSEETHVDVTERARRALNDPGAILPRLRTEGGGYELVTDWQVRALAAAGLLAAPAPVADDEAAIEPDEDGPLVAHARRELAIIGEDADTAKGVVSVVRAFSECGHSGGSAPFAIAYLERLLRFEPLSDLTSDPAEWTDRSEMSGYPMWQSARNSQAFSEDGGETYWLLSERDAAGSEETTPLHRSSSRSPATETGDRDLLAGVAHEFDGGRVATKPDMYSSECTCGWAYVDGDRRAIGFREQNDAHGVWQEHEQQVVSGD